MRFADLAASRGFVPKPSQPQQQQQQLRREPPKRPLPAAPAVAPQQQQQQQQQAASSKEVQLIEALSAYFGPSEHEGAGVGGSGGVRAKTAKATKTLSGLLMRAGRRDKSPPPAATPPAQPRRTPLPVPFNPRSILSPPPAHTAAPAPAAQNVASVAPALQAAVQHQQQQQQQHQTVVRARPLSRESFEEWERAELQAAPALQPPSRPGSMMIAAGVITCVPDGDEGADEAPRARQQAAADPSDAALELMFVAGHNSVIAKELLAHPFASQPRMSLQSASSVPPPPTRCTSVHPAFGRAVAAGQQQQQQQMPQPAPQQQQQQQQQQQAQEAEGWEEQGQGQGDAPTIEDLERAAAQLGNGATALHVAAQSDEYLPLLNALISKGLDIDKPSARNYTPMHYAVTRSAVGALAVLLSAGGNPNLQTSFGESALHLAVSREPFEMTELLCSRTRTQYELQNADGDTALHTALEEGNDRAALLLISKQLGSLNVQNHNGDTPLHIATREGNIGIVKALIAKGVAIDLPNHEGALPLHHAAGTGSPEAVRLVCDRRNVNTKDIRGDTALHNAVTRGNVAVARR
eukprot:m51a1_g13598 putative ankyrin repeat protein (578) ;mRNA; f:189-2104